jgi:hypothetical protein
VNPATGRLTRAIVVALLVVLAGCGGASTTPTATDAPGPTTATATATPTPTPSSTPAADLAYPDGTGPDGVATDGTLTRAHYAALANTSYAAAFAHRAARGTVAVDADDDEALVQYAQGDRRVTIYVTDGTGYQRVVNGSDASYRTVGLSVAVVRQQFALPALGRNYPLFEYGPASTARYRGDPVHAYSVIGANVSRVDAPNVSDVDGRLYVDDRGRVVDFRLNATYGGSTVVRRYSLAQVGSAEVTRPSWADRADGTDGA